MKEPGGKCLPDIKKSINRLLKHLQNHSFHLRENMTLFMHGNAVMKQCKKTQGEKKFVQCDDDHVIFFLRFRFQNQFYLKHFAITFVHVASSNSARCETRVTEGISG